MNSRYFDSRRNRSIAAVLLAGLFVLLYFALLGYRPLFIPDETRYGAIAREMLASGDWIVPRLNGLVYFEKPPLGYWLNAIALFVFGDNAFAVRFFNAFATGLSALMVFALGRFLFTSTAIPLMAAFVFLTMLEVQAIGTFSVLDPVFSALLNGGIAAFAASALSDGARRRWLAVAAGALFGCAFLVKGFLAFALPALVLLPWLLIRRQYRFALSCGTIALVCALVVVAPWALAIHQQQPDFWHYFFWVEHIQRFTAENAQHKAPFYYFVAYLPVLAFPWLFLLPASVRGYRNADQRPAKDGAMLLLTLWALLPFVFFSASSGKLATYILPCFVPFSLLVAAGLPALTARARGVCASLTLAAAGALLLLLALAVYIARADQPVFAPHEWSGQAALFGSLLCAAALLVFASRTRRNDARVAAVGLSVVPFMLALPLCMPETVLSQKAPEAFLQATYADLPAETIVVSNGSLVRAMSWSLNRNDIYVIEDGGESTYGLQAPDGHGRFLEPAQLAQLLDSGAGVLIVCKGRCNSETRSVLPARAVGSSSGNFFAHYIPPRVPAGNSQATASN